MSASGVCDQVQPHVDEVRTTQGKVMSLEEFRAQYQAMVAEKREQYELRKRSGLVPNPSLAPAPREPIAREPLPFVAQPNALDGELNEQHRRRHWWSVLFPFVILVVSHIFQAGVATLFIAGTDNFEERFGYVLFVLTGLRVGKFVFNRLRLQRRREDFEGASPGVSFQTPELVGVRKITYITWKSVVTLFVSMLPTFRVEALEHELRIDGLDPHRHMRPAAPPPAAAAPEAEPAAEQ